MSIHGSFKPPLNAWLDPGFNRYSWIWRDAKCILPLWEGGGDPQDLTKKIPEIILTDLDGGADTAVWRGNLHGMGARFPGVDRNALKFVVSDIEFTSTENYTLCFFMAMDDDGANDTNHYVFRSDAGVGGYWVIRRGSTYGENHKKLWIRHNGADVVTSGPIMEPYEWYAVVLTWDGATIRVYMNGNETNTKADATGVAWSLDAIGANESGAGAEISADLSVFIAAGRAWSIAEVQAWSADPLGFLGTPPAGMGNVPIEADIGNLVIETRTVLP